MRPHRGSTWRRLTVWLLIVATIQSSLGIIWQSRALRSEEIHSTSALGRVQMSNYVPPGFSGSQAPTPLTRNNYNDVPRRRSAQPSNPPPAPPPSLRSKPLEVDQSLDRALNDPLYVSQVGGVAFDRVVAPPAGAASGRWELAYDNAMPDGRRFVLYVDGRYFFGPELPDWQLLPIARYADSQYTAVVTLFGELVDGRRKENLSGVDYVVAYHPALEGTLLGLRMFQTDFMLLDPSLSGDLPKFDGKYLLGPGEATPRPEAWRPAAAQLSTLMQSSAFQSYVICDQRDVVGISLKPALAETPRFELTGGLTYHFWRRGAPVAIRRGNVIYHTHNVLPVPKLTESIHRRQDLLATTNPQVYGASVNMLRYAALFRFIKARAPEHWRSFLADLNGRIPDSRIAAPTPVLLRTR